MRGRSGVWRCRGFRHGVVATRTHLGGGDGVLGGLEIDIRHGDGARYASSGRREWGRCLRDCAVRVRRVLRWFCCDGSAMARGKKRFFPSEIFFFERKFRSKNGAVANSHVIHPKFTIFDCLITQAPPPKRPSSDLKFEVASVPGSSSPLLPRHHRGFHARTSSYTPWEACA